MAIVMFILLDKETGSRTEALEGMVDADRNSELSPPQRSVDGRSDDRPFDLQLLECWT